MAFDAGDPFSTSRESTGLYIGLSGLVHGGVVIALIVVGMMEPEGPLVDPNEVMMVTMAMPKSPDAMPHRAERAPSPAAAPAPEPTPAPEPPDPSELAFKDKKAPPKKEQPKGPTPADLAKQRSKLFDLLDDPPPDAPIGTENRSASSPDGVEGAAGTGGSVLGDPEYAAYISRVRAVFLPEFRPLPALKGQGLVTRVFVRTDAGGRIVDARISKSSGNPSWDQAALTAVRSVPTVPLPPERFRDRLSAGYTLEFSDDP